MMIKLLPRIGAIAMTAIAFTTTLQAEMANRISQYGITWTFDKSHEIGQFVSGDYWVVGPVTITSVSPEAGKSTSDAKDGAASIYGATSLIDDKTMRNGSMKSPRADVSLGKQGFDSRSKTYDPDLTLKFPVTLQPGEQIISSVSSENYDRKGKLKTPQIMAKEGDVYVRGDGTLALETLAILTVVSAPPPEDAFRPPYAGADMPLYTASQIAWDKLPNLRAPRSMPKWDKMEAIHERPTFEIPSSWLTQNFAPGMNGPNGYGREVARMNNIATLMLMTDASKSQKEKLLYEIIQLGIDTRGTVDAGRVYFSDGGWWQGRKWPILFTSIMLDEPKIAEMPPLPDNFTRIQPSSAVPNPTAAFQEDLNTYYGEGANGQEALWQMNWHTGPKPPYQEKPSSKWSKADKRSDGYCFINATTYAGTALAAQLMQAKALWNHDAFFDYADYWMSDDNDRKMPKWLPGKRTADPFVDDMWEMYREKVPAQPDGEDNVRFVWTDTNKRTGEWVENTKPDSLK